MHYQDVTRLLASALLALTLAACGDAGGDGAGGDGDAPPSECETQVACMIDQCSEAFDRYVRACNCSPNGTDCIGECTSDYLDAVVVCFQDCDENYSDDALSAFRSCAGGSADQCDDAMLACEAAP